MKFSKKQKIALLIVAIGIVVYIIYMSVTNKGKRIADGQDGVPDAEGWYYFKYAGGSALRENGTGQMPDCASTQGQPSPTDFFAFCEVGKYENNVFIPFGNANCTPENLCRILPGDTVNSFEILEGAQNTNIQLTGNSFEVLQLGTDICTANSQIAYLDNGIVIDLIVQAEGSTEPIYSTTGVVIGRFKLIAS
jgi:hypothetical protein